jgi:fatty acid desaturase
MTSGLEVELGGEPMPTKLDVRAAQSLTADLMKRRQWIYWVDFLLSWAALVGLIVLGGHAFTWWTLVALVPASWLVFRIGVFIHEIQHFRKGEATAFTIAWNALFGCPTGIPHPMYDYHRVHHSVMGYGTPADSEYTTYPEPFPPAGFLQMVKVCLMYPFLLVIRFTAGTASVLFNHQLRDKFERKLSALHMDRSRTADAWTPEMRRHWLPYELGSLAYLVAFAVLVVLRIIPISAVVFVYLAIVGGNLANQVRVMFAHGYHTRTESRSFEEQVADSFDHPSPWIFFWSPVGLGYHGTHHLFPRMPYHALGRAHRRLAASPELAPFMTRSTKPGLVRELRDKLTNGPAGPASEPAPSAGLS